MEETRTYTAYTSMCEDPYRVIECRLETDEDGWCTVRYWSDLRGARREMIRHHVPDDDEITAWIRDEERADEVYIGEVTA
ncbi:MAG: hypothetical protein U0M51_04255 [Eggerthellaceae bacterium]